MEPKGLEFLWPIWLMIGSFNNTLLNNNYIGLAQDQVRVYYTKYVNDFKLQISPLQPGQTSIRDAVNAQLTPGTFERILIF